MPSLYLRIWVTVVAALALFALVSGWVVQRHLVQERVRVEQMASERLAAWGELLQRSLPAADEPAAAQAAGLFEWSDRLRVPLALDGPDGRRIATSASYARREADTPSAAQRALAVRLDDGRTLWVMRRPRVRPGPGAQGDVRDETAVSGPRDRHDRHDRWRGEGPTSGSRPFRSDGGWSPLDLPGMPGVPDGVVLVALLALLFAAVAAGAWPVVRRLTRRLESLQRGVEVFGAGALDHRVPVEGRDEVAAVAESFNRAAGRIEALVRSHQSLLANASHELRSPLARLKMALAMLNDAAPARRAELAAEIAANIAELDGLVEEVLLASRLHAAVDAVAHDPVDLLALAAEESARVGAAVDGEPVVTAGDERLLRRAVRNLLENARRYGRPEASCAAPAVPADWQSPCDGGPAEDGDGGGDRDGGGGGGDAGNGGGVTVTVSASGGTARIVVCDRGPGVPEADRERIFEPFFRLPGHAEREGGVGLGLALVRQIAARHGGQADCAPRDGGGSCFSLSLPLSPAGRRPVAPAPHSG